MVIGVVALIVIGPKDLPEMFRTLGRFTAKLRGMAREFQRAMDDAARDTGVSDIAKDLKTATSAKSLGLEAVKSAATKFEQWDPLKSGRPGQGLTPASTSVPASQVTTTPAPTPTLGPATQAQADAQAQKAAIAREAAARMKAVSDTPVAVPSEAASADAPAAKPARKPRAPKAAPGSTVAKAVATRKAAAGVDPSVDVPAPRAPGRRRKKADESE